MANPVTELLGGATGGIFSTSVIAIMIILFLVVIGAILYYFLIYKRKFDIKVKIYSLRANDPAIVFDKGALLTDPKNKTKYFKLFNQKVELEAPSFKVLQSTNQGDYLELLRKSQDDFVYLTHPKIDKEWIIRTNGKKFPIAQLKVRQIEADWNWRIRRRESDKGWLDPDSFLSKLIQMLPILIPGVLMFLILAIFMRELPAILAELRALAQDLGSLKGAATKVQGLAWTLIHP